MRFAGKIQQKQEEKTSKSIAKTIMAHGAKSNK